MDHPTRDTLEDAGILPGTAIGYCQYASYSRETEENWLRWGCGPRRDITQISARANMWFFDSDFLQLPLLHALLSY